MASCSWRRDIPLNKGEVYRNWDFDYESTGDEIEQVGEEPENTRDTIKDPPLQPPPQPQPQLPQQKSASQSQPLPSSDLTPGSPVAKITRASQKTGDPPGTGDFTPPSFSPEQQKVRENNLSHKTHIREAMKTGLKKWKEELKKNNDTQRKAWLEHQKDVSGSWL